jgi:hypothetical protein
MSSGQLDASATCCPECGAVVSGGRAACQTLFDEVLAREFGDFRYGRIHRLTVDAYALLHPAEYMRSAKSYAAHLTGMYAALEGESGLETNQAVQRWLNGPRVLPRPSEPPQRQRGALTIAHVRDAVDPEGHVRRVREWAQSIWDAWREFHEIARRWVEEATRS